MDGERISFFYSSFAGVVVNQRTFDFVDMESLLIKYSKSFFIIDPVQGFS